MPRCIIFTNGILPDLDSARRLLRADDFILCADGGTRHARTLGLLPSIVIGDLDSLTPDDRAALESAGTKIIQHPRDKNETDLELALEHAIGLGYREIVVVAALGNRLDQTLGNIALLLSTRYPSVVTRLDDGVEEILFCRGQVQVEEERGDLVSLIPWDGDARGVRTDGLRWQLSHETLFAHKTRGISNEMTSDVVRVETESGLLLVIHRRQTNENR